MRRAYERDPVAVDLWLKQTYPLLKQRAKRLGATIFFLDEAGFPIRSASQGRTYGLKGQTPVSRDLWTATEYQRHKSGAITARGEFRRLLPREVERQKHLVAFLQNFMTGRRSKAFLVVDAAPGPQGQYG